MSDEGNTQRSSVSRDNVPQRDEQAVRDTLRT
ncbi:uncharacterized protein METZ01_LOCUS471739 [marine metagenome]|uniref:Uncharacterized protein n=1 Tax=marine metagenome TaxID=408172 RepID=A0A383BHK8_9ZZZZ